MTDYPPTSRLMDDQPEGFVAEPSLAGRSQPRVEVPAGFRHDVRFRGSYGRDCTNLAAYCGPCDWSVALEAGHDLPDLIRLVAMHSGVPAVTVTTTEALMELLTPLVVSS